MRIKLQTAWVVATALAGIGSAAVATAQAPLPSPATEAASPASPSPLWTRSAAEALLGTIEAASAEGLHPADYHPAALRTAIASGEGPALDAMAEGAALALAHDYAFGRLAAGRRQEWHISRPEDRPGSLEPMLRVALRQGRVAPFLRSLLPGDARYAALRDRLATAADPVERNRIRANMERWRWMPRGLGGDYLYVNVPSYRLQVVEGDRVASTYTVVVGAPGTPTPWLVTEAPSVVVNPWWNVPQSIIRSANMRPGSAGYVWKASAGGWQVRQPPGPRNALGKVKINLVNDQAIYLHDTPAKSGFGRPQRALSHGCVRVKGIDQLAAALVGDADAVAFEAAMASDETTTVTLPRRWPVYIVYFTIDRDADGNLVSYGDPYGRDADLIAQLDGSPLQIAAN